MFPVLFWRLTLVLFQIPFLPLIVSRRCDCLLLSWCVSPVCNYPHLPRVFSLRAPCLLCRFASLLSLQPLQHSLPFFVSWSCWPCFLQTCFSLAPLGTFATLTGFLWTEPRSVETAFLWKPNCLNQSGYVDIQIWAGRLNKARETFQTSP